jgi:hypothetical protein
MLHVPRELYDSQVLASIVCRSISNSITIICSTYPLHEHAINMSIINDVTINMHEWYQLYH